MPIKSAGCQWLKEKYNLSKHTLTHSSFIGSKESIELTSKGSIEQIYGPRYAPSTDTDFLHLEFAIKYDDISLDFLNTVFKKVDPLEISDNIRKTPASKYARIIGYLYEFLTENDIELPKPVTANYINLLDEERYITGTIVRNTKWKINNNLLGSRKFCPIVRRTKTLNGLLQIDIRQKIEQLKQSYPGDIFKRATNYLYNKETRSSYEIEKEKPSPDRMEKFVALLIKAGLEDTEQMLEKNRLLQMQNAIVDQRFAAADFRDFQNFVGESLPDYQDMIHYICPPPGILTSLMKGLQESAIKTNNTYPQVKAALIAFGFVFIHPFEDGNGRIHRFLIHDILVHDGLVPSGLIIPVSAHMLNNIKDYDIILEKYSKPLMQRIKYDKKNNGEVIVRNLDEVEGYFRYPDLTEHCIYLIQTIHATLEEDMLDELIFLQRYEETKKELQRIVDMPDRYINLMITFLHQNKGIFPKRRRDQFSKLTDDEIQKMQNAYRTVYELDPL